MRAGQASGSVFRKESEGLGPLASGERSDHQPRCLIGQRLGQDGMPMTERCDGDAGKEIQKHVTIGIGKRGAIAAIESDSSQKRNTLSSGSNVRLLVGKYFFRVRPRDSSRYLG